MPDRRSGLFVALACAVTAIAVVWWATHRRPALHTAGDEDSSEQADRRGRRADGNHARTGGGSRGASAQLVSVRGTVFDARTSQAVGGGEVVFRGAAGEVTTTAD